MYVCVGTICMCGYRMYEIYEVGQHVIVRTSVRSRFF